MDLLRLVCFGLQKDTLWGVPRFPTSSTQMQKTLAKGMQTDQLGLKVLVLSVVKNVGRRICRRSKGFRRLILILCLPLFRGLGRDRVEEKQNQFVLQTGMVLVEVKPGWKRTVVFWRLCLGHVEIGSPDCSSWT